MFRFQKKKCTNEIMGKVIKKRWNGNIWFLTAEYIVEGKAPLGNLKEGDFVRIKYNPQKPKKSYMPDNDGMLLT